MPVRTRSRSPRSPEACSREVDSPLPAGPMSSRAGKRSEAARSSAAPNRMDDTTMANLDLPRAQGSVRPRQRARRLRCRLRRGPARPPEPRHRRQGHHRPVQPAAPGRLGLRGEHRRRRRDPPPDPGPLPARGRGLRPPRGRRVRHRDRLPAQGRGDADKAVAAIDAIVADEGLRVLGWRDVPTDDSMLGATARSVAAVVPPGVHGRA